MTEQQAKNKAFQDGQLAFAQMFVNQSNDNSKNQLKNECLPLKSKARRPF